MLCQQGYLGVTCDPRSHVCILGVASGRANILDACWLLNYAVKPFELCIIALLGLADFYAGYGFRRFVGMKGVSDF